MLSLADVLDLPVVRRALPEVVVGRPALGREVRWAHVIEMPQPDDLLKGGELVLTTGLGAGADPAHQAAWTASLTEQRLAAPAVELGSRTAGGPPAGGRGRPELARRAARGGRGLRPRRGAGDRLPSSGALHRDHRGGARRGRQRVLRAARPRRGDPSPLHRIDPAGSRRSGDPRGAGRGGEEPRLPGGRGGLARVLRERPRG